MALALGDAAAGVKAKAAAMSQLQKQYAGDTAAQVAAYMAANPGQTDPTQTVAGWLPSMPALQAQAAGINGVAAPAQTTQAEWAPTPNSWGTGGEGGLQYWSDQNTRPPGADDPTRPWVYDSWGGSWRRDYDPNRPGVISGSGY